MATSTDREILHNIYSDTYKDAYGCRPRHDTSHMSDADMEAEISGLNRHAWADSLMHDADQAGVDLTWEQVGRMDVAEMAHRREEIRALKPATSGEGWRFTR
jgi:hypothetical protein